MLGARPLCFKLMECGIKAFRCPRSRQRAFLYNFVLLHRQLDKNQISCIEEGAFRALRGLEVL